MYDVFLLTKEQREEFAGPEYREVRIALREEERWRRWPETGRPPFVDALLRVVVPALFAALERIVILAVQLVAQSTELTGKQKHDRAVGLVLEIAGTGRDQVEAHAGDLVRWTFDGLRDHDELGPTP